jgi:hypothetical protein
MEFRNLDISQIDPNPDNPRGIDIQTEDAGLSYLKDSVSRFGVMVPVVVTPRDGRYLLVDGERRYYAAKATGLETLPAYILTGRAGKALTSRDLLFRMFQIHHLRDQWGPIQQCAALEGTYDAINRRKDIRALRDVRVQVKAITEKLAAATGIDERTAFDRIKFLRWPSAVKEALYQEPQDGSYWYICEIEEKIVIPALSNYPEYFRKVPVSDVRRYLFEKLNVSLERTTEVRKVAPYFREALSRSSDKKKILRIMDRLCKDTDMTYSEAQEELRHAFPDIQKQEPPTPRRLLGAIGNLETQIDQFDIASLEKAQRRAKVKCGDLVEAARSLMDALGRLLDQLKEK